MHAQSHSIAFPHAGKLGLRMKPTSFHQINPNSICAATLEPLILRIEFLHLLDTDRLST